MNGGVGLCEMEAITCHVGALVRERVDSEATGDVVARLERETE